MKALLRIVPRPLVHALRARLLRNEARKALSRYLQATDEIAYQYRDAETIAPSLKRLRRHGLACAALARRYRMEGVQP